MSESKEWLEKIKEVVKNDETNQEFQEFQEFLDAVQKLESDEETQEKVNSILEDFNLKAHDVTEQVTQDPQLIEFDDNDWKYFEKLMKKVNWNGENVELLLKAYENVKNARDKARSEQSPEHITLTGLEIYSVLQQLNNIEGKGIDRAAKFFGMYEKFGRAFIRFKDIKQRNDRIIKKYEAELQNKIKELTEVDADKVNELSSADSNMELVD